MKIELKKSDIRHLTSDIKITLILIIALTCPGCFRRFTQTNSQIKEYFADKPVKPTYFTIQNDSAKLFCAVAGADTLPPLLIIHGAPGAWYGSRFGSPVILRRLLALVLVIAGAKMVIEGLK